MVIDKALCGDNQVILFFILFCTLTIARDFYFCFISVANNKVPSFTHLGGFKVAIHMGSS
jgi:hypothetical protein